MCCPDRRLGAQADGGVKSGLGVQIRQFWWTSLAAFWGIHGGRYILGAGKTATRRESDVPGGCLVGHDERPFAGSTGRDGVYDR